GSAAGPDLALEARLLSADLRGEPRRLAGARGGVVRRRSRKTALRRPHLLRQFPRLHRAAAPLRRPDVYLGNEDAAGIDTADEAHRARENDYRRERARRARQVAGAAAQRARGFPPRVR